MSIRDADTRVGLEIMPRMLWIRRYGNDGFAFHAAASEAVARGARRLGGQR
jgi:hypothetical protein